jgi:hypothetical protein
LRTEDGSEEKKCIGSVEELNKIDTAAALVSCL